MGKKLKKKLICFDLDNTLIRSNKAHVKAFEMAISRNKLSKISSKRIESLLNGRHAHAVVKLLFPRLDNNIISKIVNDHHKFIAKTSSYARQIPGAVRTLKGIKKEYEMALVSNCMHKEINALMKSTKINKGIFDFVIGKEDVRRGKPYPDEIFKAEHMANLNADFMIGDSIYDVMAAKKAGVTAISVLTGMAKKKELLNERSDFIIRDVTQLPQLLKRISNKKEK